MSTATIQGGSAAGLPPGVNAAVPMRDIMPPVRARGGLFGFVRRNPGQAAAWALALGFAVARARRRRARGPQPDIPVMNTGHARLYDPDEKMRHTPHGGFDTRRDFPIRA